MPHQIKPVRPEECIREINYPQDIEFLKNIWQRHANNQEEWKKVDEEIRCSKTITHVNIVDKEIVAFIVISDQTCKDAMQNYVYELHAYPTGKKYGEQLIKYVQKERQFLCLHVKKDNPAIKFYKDHKFTIRNATPDGLKYCMTWENKNRAEEYNGK